MKISSHFKFCIMPSLTYFRISCFSRHFSGVLQICKTLVYKPIIVDLIFATTRADLSNSYIVGRSWKHFLSICAGSYLLGLWRTHALKDTSNFPSPTLTIPTASSSSVQDNLTEPLMDYGREEGNSDCKNFN